MNTRDFCLVILLSRPQNLLKNQSKTRQELPEIIQRLRHVAGEYKPDVFGFFLMLTTHLSFFGSISATAALVDPVVEVDTVPNVDLAGP